MFRNRLTLCLAVVAVVAFGVTVAADKPKKETLPNTANVFPHPGKLTSGDELTDGENGPAIEIKGDTVFVWVDRMPDARFAHPTEYVLISASGTKVVKGQWWPMLNGKPLFRDSDAPSGVPVKLGGGDRK